MPSLRQDMPLEGTHPDDPWPASFSRSIEISDRGLVVGAESLLVRMTGEGHGAPRLALDVDGERLLALLSVASGEPARADMLRHVAAASDHWQRGDKALANLRLVFAGLPRLQALDDAYRLSLAEHLLDEGFAPRALLKALGLDASVLDLVKYAPDQPRVPAGSGRESGRWTNGTGGFVPSIGSKFGGGIVVAANEGPPEDHKAFDEREASGLTTPSENVAHGYPITPTDGTPAGYGLVFNQLSAVAKQAVEVVGPGRGPVYGTAVHTEFAARTRSLDSPNLAVEQSYLNGRPAARGIRGSVRLDSVLIDGIVEKPKAVFDLKTGGAVLGPGREKQIRSHLPDDYQDVPIVTVRP